ncbi:hypothetical protein ACP6PK_14125 [Dapis sp. BLCC M172]
MEEKSSIKHEYIDGEIYTVARASDAHVTIGGNYSVVMLYQLPCINAILRLYFNS